MSFPPLMQSLCRSCLVLGLAAFPLSGCDGDGDGSPGAGTDVLRITNATASSVTVDVTYPNNEVVMVNLVPGPSMTEISTHYAAGDPYQFVISASDPVLDVGPSNTCTASDQAASLDAADVTVDVDPATGIIRVLCETNWTHTDY